LTSFWLPGAGEQLREIIVYAGHAEVRLALERATQVAHAVVSVLQELDDGEDEVVVPEIFIRAPVARATGGV
jgi:hypothetical protein